MNLNIPELAERQIVALFDLAFITPTDGTAMQKLTPNELKYYAMEGLIERLQILQLGLREEINELRAEFSLAPIK